MEKPVLSSENAHEIAEQVAAWVQTPAGQAAIAEAHEKAKQFAREMAEAQRKANEEWERIKHIPICPPRREWYDD